MICQDCKQDREAEEYLAAAQRLLKNRDAEITRLSADKDALLAALRDMLELHGNPHREEWLNQETFELAKVVHERAHAAIKAAEEGK